MIKNKRFVYAVIFLAVTVLFIQFFQVPTFADVGNTFGNSGSSKSSNNWDYGGGSSSSSDGDSFWLFYMIFRMIPFPFNFILIGVIILLAKSKSNNQGNRRQNNYRGNNMTNNYQRDPWAVNDSDAINKIRSNDENFSKNEFINYVNTVFIKVQEAWEARQWSVIRPFESNELFERHETQLNEYIEKNLYPHLDKQEILSTKIADYELDGKYEYLTVQLKANVIDFTTNEDGDVVDGSKKDYRFRVYKLKFKRVNGVKTKHDNKTNVTNCPNCGAPSDVTSSGKCEYCSSVITTGEYGWVLDEYSQWRN